MNSFLTTNFKTMSIILIAFFSKPTTSVQINQIGTLTVDISNLKSDEGQVLVQLYRKTDKVPSAPFVILKSKIINNKADVDFENLSFNDYAIIVVHDVNSNDIIDHKWGFSAEPLGYSNEWKLSLLSGMPTFDKLKFALAKRKQNYPVKMP